MVNGEISPFRVESTRIYGSSVATASVAWHINDDLTSVIIAAPGGTSVALPQTPTTGVIWRNPGNLIDACIPFSAASSPGYMFDLDFTLTIRADFNSGTTTIAKIVIIPVLNTSSTDILVNSAIVGSTTDTNILLNSGATSDSNIYYCEPLVLEYDSPLVIAGFSLSKKYHVQFNLDGTIGGVLRLGYIVFVPHQAVATVNNDVTKVAGANLDIEFTGQRMPRFNPVLTGTIPTSFNTPVDVTVTNTPSVGPVTISNIPLPVKVNFN